VRWQASITRHSLRLYSIKYQISFAGIFSARVLADHFENVLIIEAEEWVTSAEGAQYDPSRKRTGVSQYTFLHGFQAFLGLALHGMFGDSFEEELNKGGGR
jgi:hypothetical protein